MRDLGNALARFKEATDVSLQENEFAIEVTIQPKPMPRIRQQYQPPNNPVFKTMMQIGRQTIPSCDDLKKE